MWRKWVRPGRGTRRAYAQVAIAAVSLAVAGYYLDKSYEYANRLDMRMRATAAVNNKAANLQAAIDHDLGFVRNIQIAISLEPAISAATFQDIAARVFARSPDTLQIMASGQNTPFLTATRPGTPAITPPPESIAATEVSFIETPASASERSFSGLFPIAPGRYGFYARVPIFVRANGKIERWGDVAAIIDAESLFRSAQLAYSGNDQFHFAIKPARGDEGSFKPFFRIDETRTIFASDPVTANVDALSSRWTVGAIPVGGWEQARDSLILLRSGFLLFSMLLITPLLLSARVRLDRHRTITELRARERELETISRRLDLALESYRCGVWEGVVGRPETYWDRRMHELHGTGGDATQTLRRNWLRLVHPDDRERVRNILDETTRRHDKFSFRCRITRPDGSLRYVRYVGQHQFVSENDERLFGIAFDDTDEVAMTEELVSAKTETERKNAALETALDELSQRESELKETSQRLKIAMDAFECGIWEADMNNGETYWDERMHAFYGLPFVNPITPLRLWEDLLYAEDAERTIASADHAIASGERYSDTYRIVTVDGSVRYMHSVGQRHIDAKGVNKFIGLSIDVTEDMLKNQALLSAKDEAEAKRAELEAIQLRIQHNATHDPLTGLKNRRGLDEALEQMSGETARHGERVTLLHIDLDRFKQINDTLGHAAGDAMLIHAANVLLNNIRGTDIAARIGGDEFVVLFRNTATNKEVEALARRIIDRMNQPVDYNGHECRFGVSIGAARERPTPSAIRRLQVNADIALYRAKAHGRNRVEFFTSSLQAEIRNTKRLADDILRGIDNGEFRAWYQPQFSAATLKLTGVEALVRWHHPERGTLTPDAFLKTAEEINAVATIDHQVLQNALIDRLQWAADGLIVPRVSVNVSARRLRDPLLIKTLKDLSIGRGQIAFELVESIFLDDNDDIVTRNIRRLKGLGIELEIDDFGTGHTSIVSLLKVEPKRLKIDRQLVSPMLTSAREFSLVRSIVEIGTSLDIEIIAEGVETMEHAAKLKELGCDMLQGYAFSRPVQASELPAVIRRLHAARQESGKPPETGLPYFEVARG